MAPRIQVGRFAFAFFGGLAATFSLFAALLASSGAVSPGAAVLASALAFTIGGMGLGVVAMIRRRLTALDRDVRATIAAHTAPTQRALVDLKSELTRASFDPAEYWRNRAQHYGKLAVGDIARLPEFDAETVADKRDLLGLLKQQLRGDEARTLDFGCGFGRFTHALAEVSGTDVVGVDLTPELLAIAEREKTSPKVTFARATDPLPFPDESFDVVWVSYVFIHILGAQKDRTARELGRVLKKGGLLFLTEGVTTWRTGSAHCEFAPMGWYLQAFPFPLTTYTRHDLKAVSVEDVARMEPEFRAADRDLHVVFTGRKV
ncbi:class I SAM-dependent methyltransferase [Myxococcota bacterium]|nr:class I SAM-dependent methyltransferase [Myxococcota bacterium]